MAELTLKQIEDKLNDCFNSDKREIVFWYDDNAQFAEDIENVTLDNAKIYILEPDNQFYTKLLLERIDTISNYLIYAPFAKPDVTENHLEDTLLYSYRFYADRVSLLMHSLNIKEMYKPVMMRYKKYFDNKERMQRFEDIEVDDYNDENTIVLCLLCAVCKVKICSFEEVLKAIITSNIIDDNSYLNSFETYGLLDDFWKQCDKNFGYRENEPTMKNFIYTLFITYASRCIDAPLPAKWNNYISKKSGSVISFLNNLKHNNEYSQYFDYLSMFVDKSLGVAKDLLRMKTDSLIDCDCFLCVDKILIQWLSERLISEDTGASLGALDIPAVCEHRTKLHFSSKTGNTYNMLGSAYYIISSLNYDCPDSFEEIISAYKNYDWKIDRAYRDFYYCFDMLENPEGFDSLRNSVEKIYTNVYLSTQLQKWNGAIQDDKALLRSDLQRNFYNLYVRPATYKEHTVVIISDAMRYEVGRELFEKLQSDPKCTVNKFDSAISVLPSYTHLGMAALLPHSNITVTDDYNVLVDGILCDKNSNRQKVLQSYVKDSVCVQFDEVKSCHSKADYRKIFTGKDVVYVFHNQIDTRGDTQNTEDEVFTACKEAVTEIYDIIKRISSNGNTHRFIITSDHGFIYRRDKLSESDKIDIQTDKQSFVNHRFIVSDSPVKSAGIGSLNLGYILGNNDCKCVSYPINSNIFKAPGGGQNFVHGGSSPQEMIIPIIDVKRDRNHTKTKKVGISLVSAIRKVTNLITTVDFIQSEPVKDTVVAADYRIAFKTEDDNIISNEIVYRFDSSDTVDSNRIFRLKFNLKNQKYDSSKNYYLVAALDNKDDDENNENNEVIRHSVIIDLAFTDDFGF